MHFGASSVVSNIHTDFHLEIVQPLAHTTQNHRYQSSFVWSLQGVEWEGQDGSQFQMPIKQGNDINNLGSTVNFLKGIAYSDSQLPVPQFVNVHVYQVRQGRALPGTVLFVIIQPFFYYSFWGKRQMCELLEASYQAPFFVFFFKRRRNCLLVNFQNLITYDLGSEEYLVLYRSMRERS